MDDKNSISLHNGGKLMKTESSTLEEIQSQSVETCKIFVGGLNPSTTSETLKSYFSQFGDIKEFMVMRDIVHKRSRGFGFVTFADYSGVIKVLEQENHILDSKKIDPKLAVPKSVCQPEKISTRTKKIFIGGIATSTTADEIRHYFGRFGEVESCELMMDKSTNRHRGFGFVTFSDEDVAEHICQIHYHNINNKMVEAKKALPKELLSASNTTTKSESKPLQVPLAILPNSVSPTIPMNTFLQQNGGSLSHYMSLPYLQTNCGQLLINPHVLQLSASNGINSIQSLDPSLFPSDITPYLSNFNNVAAAYIPPVTPSLSSNYIGHVLPTLTNGTIPMQNLVIDLYHQGIAADPKLFQQTLVENPKSNIYSNTLNVNKRLQNSNPQQNTDLLGSMYVDMKDQELSSNQSVNSLVGRYNTGLMTMMMMSGNLDNTALTGNAVPDFGNTLDNPTGDTVWLIPAKIPRVH